MPSNYESSFRVLEHAYKRLIAQVATLKDLVGKLKEDSQHAQQSPADAAEGRESLAWVTTAISARSGNDYGTPGAVALVDDTVSPWQYQTAVTDTLPVVNFTGGSQPASTYCRVRYEGGRWKLVASDCNPGTYNNVADTSQPPSSRAAVTTQNNAALTTQDGTPMATQ